MKKKPTPTESGQVQIIRQGLATTEKMETLIVETLNDIDAETPATKHPVTVTKGDRWICISSIIGQACMTIRFSQLMPEGGQS